MSKNQIEYRVRMIFYFVFGVLFSFLFIMSSIYIDFARKVNDRQKEQIQALLVEGFKVREKYLYEEFLTKSYDSIKFRTNSFLRKQLIERYDVVMLDNEKGCVTENEKKCDIIKRISKKFINDDITFYSTESYGEFYILYNIKGWGQSFGLYAVSIPLTEISEESTLSKTLIYYIIPFLLLIFSTFAVYRLTEKMIIRPTIKRIIDSEKIQAEKELLRQFAHDIRSPVVTLETVLDVYSDVFPDESKDLIAKAIKKITNISQELLHNDKNKRNDRVEILSLLRELEIDKKLEFKKQNIQFIFDLSDDVVVLYVSKIRLARALSNLINNAIEANSSDSIVLKISIQKISDHVLLSLEDNSGGIQEDKIPFILSGDYSSKENGNSLGVSSTAKWIREIGGNLEIKTKTGVGTIVELYFPLGATFG